MNSAEFSGSIRNVWRYLEHVRVGQIFSGPTSLSASSSFRDKSLDPDTNYEQLYLCGLKNSDYNILLVDYAYFQFSFSGQSSFRFAYYPNPFLGASEIAISELNEKVAYVEEGLIDVDEYLHSISELRYSQHPPMVRYENDPCNYVELDHPCSHFHIGHHSDNRWPVSRVLSPAAFSLIILKMFYREFWVGSAPITVGGNLETMDQVLQRRRQECQQLPEQLFSAAEQLHFKFC